MENHKICYVATYSTIVTIYSFLSLMCMLTKNIDVMHAHTHTHTNIRIKGKKRFKSQVTGSDFSLFITMINHNFIPSLATIYTAVLFHR